MLILMRLSIRRRNYKLMEQLHDPKKNYSSPATITHEQTTWGAIATHSNRVDNMELTL